MLKSTLTPPSVDQSTIDFYVAKGRRERSRAFTQMIKSLFSSPETSNRPSGRVSGANVKHA